jgi:hypothetical protein
MDQPRKLDYETPVKKIRIFSMQRIIAGGIFAVYGLAAIGAGYALVRKIGKSNGLTLPEIGLIFILCLVIQVCLWQGATIFSRVAKL